jgi:hypothetical protein
MHITLFIAPLTAAIVAVLTFGEAPSGNFKPFRMETCDTGRPRLRCSEVPYGCRRRTLPRFGSW